MATSRDLPPELREEVDKLAAMRDEDIDFSDIPEGTDFSGFHRPECYRPIKQQLTLRLLAMAQTIRVAHGLDHDTYDMTAH